MAVGSPLLSMDNALFRIFMGHAAIVIFKTMLVALLTAYYRTTKKVFANPEDAKAGGAKKGVVKEDPDVDRARRIHQNDLENVIPFVLLGLIYTAIGPDVYYAALHFRVFSFSRIAHTICYQFAIPQPSRALAFLIGVIVNVSMCVQILMHAAF